MGEQSGEIPFPASDPAAAALPATDPAAADYRALFDFAPVGQVVTGRTGQVLAINITGAELLGQPRARIVGRPFTLYLDPDERDTWREHLARVAGGDGAGTRLRLGGAAVQGRTLLVHSRPVRDHLGRIGAVHTGFQDGSAECRTEAEQVLVHRAFQSARDGVLITDRDNRILFANAGFTRVTGYRAEEVSGLRPSLLASGRHDAEFYRAMWDSLRDTGNWEGQIWNRRKDGEVYPEWLSISVVRGASGQVEHYLALFSEIGAFEERRRSLHRIAFYDPVTDLPNRHLFLDRLERTIAQAARLRQRVGVMFLDLDRFKLINDTLGHRAGDRLLAEAGQRLRECLRESDTASRMGGDEFTLLLPGVRSRTNSVVVANKVLQAFKRPFALAGGQYYLGTSIGISHYPDDGEDADTLIRRADAAMYRAKEQGGNTYYLYQCGVDHRVARRLDLENALRQGLERGELELHYQPQVELANGRIRAVEALVRWRHPVQGLIAPAEFLPVAEECGLIVPLGRWVLHEACRQLGEWKRQGVQGLRMAVNISPHQFLDRSLPQTVLEAMAEGQLGPGELELEITESAAMPTLEYSVRMLGELGQAGLRVAIDDFGTGFSSLGQIKRLPIHCLKVAQEFMRDIPGDPADTAIALTIVRLARLLGLDLVVEGVESCEQLQILQGEQFGLAQGYLFSRPLPAAELLPLLRAGVAGALGSAA